MMEVNDAKETRLIEKYHDSSTYMPTHEQNTASDETASTQSKRNNLLGSKDGEADLLIQLIKCEINPGHSKFILVKKFTLNHLPVCYQDNDLYEFIKRTADLTVRVAVKMTSPHRPDLWPRTKVTYPFYDMRGKTSLRTGSGIVRGQVEKFIDGCDQFGCQWKKNRHCWCLKCQHSDSPNRVWWEFNVLTAAHVVFDDIEAAHTSLRLFYDDSDSPVVSLDHVKVVYVNSKSDICVLKCVTCDETLAGRLNIMWGNFNRVWKKVSEKYKMLKSVDRLSFIVSHPHGGSKMVSIGQWVNIYLEEVNLIKISYTTCACPGSASSLYGVL